MDVQGKQKYGIQLTYFKVIWNIHNKWKENIIPNDLKNLKNILYQDRLFLLIASIRNSRCFIDQNNTYCLPIDKNSLSCFYVLGKLTIVQNFLLAAAKLTKDFRKGLTLMILLTDTSSGSFWV